VFGDDSFSGLYLNAVKLYTSTVSVFFSDGKVSRVYKVTQLNAKIFFNLALAALFVGVNGYDIASTVMGVWALTLAFQGVTSCF
jgi:hypothetical protein